MKKKEKYYLQIFVQSFSILIVMLFLSCSKTQENNVPVITEKPAARALAILQTGAYPLWFQMTQDGPAHIETIDYAKERYAYVPWPLAVHVRFFIEKDGEIVMAVNRSGFIKISTCDTGLAMYFFPAREYWQQYTVAGLVNYNDHDIALIYLDDRFLPSNAEIPNPRTWSFNMESVSVFPVDIPALEIFSAEEGWDADTLRQGQDNFWYYRFYKKRGEQQVLYLVTEDLSLAGERTTMQNFYSSAPLQNEVDTAYLPELPEGFVYTGKAHICDSLFACWEEQNEFFIGAAGFLLINTD